MDWYVAYVTIEKDHEYSYNNPFPPVLLKNETFFEVLKEVLSILYPKENPRKKTWEKIDTDSIIHLNAESIFFKLE